MTVYVISKTGKPLMPTERHGKVEHLLKQGLAKVIKTRPFTIKLLYATTEYTQPSHAYLLANEYAVITVGVDIGASSEAKRSVDLSEGKVGEPKANRVPVSALANGRIVYLKEKILRLEVKETKW